MAAPGFDPDLRLLHCAEDPTIEQFIAQLAVDGFHISVLARTTELDIGGLGANSGYPVSQCCGHELRPLVGVNAGCNRSRRRVEVTRRGGVSQTVLYYGANDLLSTVRGRENILARVHSILRESPVFGHFSFHGLGERTTSWKFTAKAG